MHPARTEGCPIQHNATCVTGVCLAHGLLCTSGRVTTQRSAVVTRTHSGHKYVACQNFLKARPTAAGIMVSFAKYLFQHWERQRRKTYLYSLQAISFIRGHCGKVANKAPPGRATGASAKAAILPQPRAAPKGLSIFDIRAATGLFYSAGIRLCQTTSIVPGSCLWPLSCRAHYSQTAGLSCLLKRRC